jgi:hypothetical protein
VKGVRGKLKKKCGDIDDGKIETMGAYIVKMKRTCLEMQDVFIFVWSCRMFSFLVDRKEVQAPKTEDSYKQNETETQACSCTRSRSGAQTRG